MSDVTGVILAGGLSRRMEGPEKSLLKVSKKLLVQHVAERLSPQVSQIVLNANGDASRFDELGLPVQPDTISGFAGPLAGVLAGMRWTETNSCSPYIATAAADTPFFPKAYVDEMLAAAKSDNATIVLAASNDRKHPVFGLWSVELADELERFLVVEENRKVMMFVERYPHCLVNFLGTDPDPFFNINTPQDLENAKSIFEQQGKI